LDQEVGAVLAALAQRPDVDHTLVMLLADHGEGMASHRLVTKGGTLYEEAARVPWVVAGPGVSHGAACRGVPVSTLDLVPTLIHAAGLAPAEGLPGCSLLPWLCGGSAPVGREAIVSYWQGSETYFTPARLVRTRRHTYIHYREDQAEELFDLETDPGQTRNLAADPACARVLAEHRRLLNEHVQRTGDPYFEYAVVLPANRRKHADEECPFIRFNMP
jgi:choline-sulfatase